jgi:hypothetical protein
MGSNKLKNQKAGTREVEDMKLAGYLLLDIKEIFVFLRTNTGTIIETTRKGKY